MLAGIISTRTLHLPWRTVRKGADQLIFSHTVQMNSEGNVVMATEDADVIATIVRLQFQHAGKPKYTKGITCMASMKRERQVGITLIFLDNPSNIS